MARRMIETDLQEEDRKIEGTLRPQKLKDYIGQKQNQRQSSNLYTGCQAAE